MGTKTEKVTDSSFINEVRKPSTNPRAEIKAADFVKYIEAVEAAYPADLPTEILTRVRQAYYPGHREFDKPKFDALIPDAPNFLVAPVSPQMPTPPRRELASPPVDLTAYQSLTAKADENGKEDNPSPYLIDANNNRVDVGHALLGLDALRHPRAGEPYKSFGIDNIDPASWVADLATAVYWTASNGDTAPKIYADKTDWTRAFNVYYYVAAPDEDLFGDADTFGLFEQWKSNQNAMGGKEDKLSNVLRAYYLGAGGATPLVNRRWGIFCEANKFDYAMAGGKVIMDFRWESYARQTYRRRINRMCDLLQASFGSLVSTADPVKWPFTDEALYRFQQFIAPRLYAELRVP